MAKPQTAGWVPVILVGDRLAVKRPDWHATPAQVTPTRKRSTSRRKVRRK